MKGAHLLEPRALRRTPRATGHRQAARLQNGARSGCQLPRWRRGAARALPGSPPPAFSRLGARLVSPCAGCPSAWAGVPAAAARAMWLLGWWQVLLWVLAPPARGLEGECGLGPGPWPGRRAAVLGMRGEAEVGTGDALLPARRAGMRA